VRLKADYDISKFPPTAQWFSRGSRLRMIWPTTAALVLHGAPDRAERRGDRDAKRVKGSDFEW